MVVLYAGLKSRIGKVWTFLRKPYPKLTAGSQFQPMMQLDTVRIYQQINRILVEEKGYAGMFLVFDEFSKYLRDMEQSIFQMI